MAAEEQSPEARDCVSLGARSPCSVADWTSGLALAADWLNLPRGTQEESRRGVGWGRGGGEEEGEGR